MPDTQTAAASAADTPPRPRPRHVGPRVRPAPLTVRSTPEQPEDPMTARVRLIFREELVGMPPEMLAQLAERLRAVKSATGIQNVFTVPEAAAYTRHSPRQIWRLVRSGLLRSTRLAGSSRVLITRADLDELLARGER
jgi:excisionase family DNA binding protein